MPFFDLPFTAIFELLVHMFTKSEGKLSLKNKALILIYRAQELGQMGSGARRRVLPATQAYSMYAEERTGPDNKANGPISPSEDYFLFVGTFINAANGLLNGFEGLC